MVECDMGSHWIGSVTKIERRAGGRRVSPTGGGCVVVMRCVVLSPPLRRPGADRVGPLKAYLYIRSYGTKFSCEVSRLQAGLGGGGKG